MSRMVSDLEVRQKGLNILFKSLGEVDAIRFLSQITYEKRDYLKLQDELFEGMGMEEIYKKAKEYSEKKQKGVAWEIGLWKESGWIIERFDHEQTGQT